MQYILIADSGSTKTDWCVVQNAQQIRRHQTKGMNPFFQTQEEMEMEIRHNLFLSLPSEQPSAIYFYGAGCTPEKAPMVKESLERCFPSVQTIEVNSDLLAAARGLCGHQPGIACILGTGSNSCFYDGEAISFNVPALGFILGDEGSGANLGKRLMGDILKNQFPAELKAAFFEECGTSMAEIIDRVYRQPFPSRFLAGFSPFLSHHREHPAVHQLLVNAFKSFIRRNVMQYDYEAYPMNCVGSIADIYRNEVAEAAQLLDVTLGQIMKSPMEGLVNYHAKPHLRPLSKGREE